MTNAAKTKVTFHSDLFNKTERRSYFETYNAFGDDVCKFLIDMLAERGVECDPYPVQGYGKWKFHLTMNRVQYLLTCGLREDLPPICEDNAVPSDGAWICDVVDAWNGLGERVIKTITKGREVLLTGRLAVNVFTREDNGVTVEVHKPILKLTSCNSSGLERSYRSAIHNQSIIYI